MRSKSQWRTYKLMHEKEIGLGIKSAVNLIDEIRLSCSESLTTIYNSWLI